MNHEKCVIIVGLVYFAMWFSFVCNHACPLLVYCFLHVHIEQWLVSVAAIFISWPNSRILYMIVILSCDWVWAGCVWCVWREGLCWLYIKCWGNFDELNVWPGGWGWGWQQTCTVPSEWKLKVSGTVLFRASSRGLAGYCVWVINCIHMDCCVLSPSPSPLSCFSIPWTRWRQHIPLKY